MTRTTILPIVIAAFASMTEAAVAKPLLGLSLAPDTPTIPASYLSVEDGDDGNVLLELHIPGVDDPRLSARLDQNGPMKPKKAGSNQRSRARFSVGYTTVSIIDERTEEETTVDSRKQSKPR